MEHIKTFENYNSKISFYDDNDRWFSTGYSLNSIDEHKKRFGDNITFSVSNIDRKFNTKEEYLEYVKINKSVQSIGTTVIDKTDVESAKDRVAKKREMRNNKWWRF